MKLNRNDPFNPADPKDAMSEMFRRLVLEMFTDAQRVTLFRDLNPDDQMKCFLVGSMVGLLNVGFAGAGRRQSDALMESILDCMPACREMAELMLDEAGWK